MPHYDAPHPSLLSKLHPQFSCNGRQQKQLQQYHFPHFIILLLPNAQSCSPDHTVQSGTMPIVTPAVVGWFVSLHIPSTCRPDLIPTYNCAAPANRRQQTCPKSPAAPVSPSAVVPSEGEPHSLTQLPASYAVAADATATSPNLPARCFFLASNSSADFTGTPNLLHTSGTGE